MVRCLSELDGGCDPADCFVPEFWVTAYPPTSLSAGAGLHCMVGFIAGEAAHVAAAMRQSAVVRKALDQLDAMFGENRRLVAPHTIDDVAVMRTMAPKAVHPGCCFPAIMRFSNAQRLLSSSVRHLSARDSIAPGLRCRHACSDATGNRSICQGRRRRLGSRALHPWRLQLPYARSMSCPSVKCMPALED